MARSYKTSIPSSALRTQILHDCDKVSMTSVSNPNLRHILIGHGITTLGKHYFSRSIHGYAPGKSDNVARENACPSKPRSWGPNFVVQMTYFLNMGNGAEGQQFLPCFAVNACP